MPALNPQELVTASACFQCLGMSQGQALQLALWETISQTIGGGGGETFYILSNVGDALISQVGDNLVYQ